MRHLLTALLVSATLGSLAASQAPTAGPPATVPSNPTATEIATALQRKYDTVRDFSADFTQEAESGALRRKLVERGTLLVKKPGKMRWTYKEPEEKLFVSDGTRMYMHTPADNQVIVSPVPGDDQATTAILFLSGKGSLTRDFDVSYGDGGDATSHALKLNPKVAERDYDWLLLVVDRSTLQIRTLTAMDNQGNRQTFRFSNFKENLGLSDKTFAFSIPRGADVIHTGSTSR